MKNFLLLTLLAVFSLSVAHAQSDQEIGLSFGIMNYQGDLIQKYVDLKESNFAFGVNYRNFLTRKIALRAGVNFGKITGSDLDYSERFDRGITMENNLVEISLLGEWHPLLKLPYDDDGNFRSNISPFGGIGLGMVFSNETLTVVGNSTLKPEDNVGALAVLPVDLGVRFALKPNFTFTVSGGTRLTFSDRLDGVSNNGNQGADDWYFVAGLGLFYTW
jgi:opacity protein-like surface antigen